LFGILYAQAGANHFLLTKFQLRILPLTLPWHATQP
jgi:uncharacterized membrane protein